MHACCWALNFQLIAFLIIPYFNRFLPDLDRNEWFSFC